MDESTEFQEWLRRVRRGDAEAARDLVARFGPHIRRVARFELRDPRLRRLLDSEDVWQSVAAAFFARAAAGDYELESAKDLLSLLAAMARNRARHHLERERAAKRDHRRTVPLDEDSSGTKTGSALASSGPGQSSVLASREILERFLTRLSPEERRVAELRAEGNGWADVAAKLGGGPEAIRKRHERACRRVACELRLEEEDGGHG